ncbi:MAG: hypothetical protein HQ511_09920 [Rhodospirillales bacterium]|nr:hypothetical protein [Rhodospirillales bacterium]
MRGISSSEPNLNLALILEQSEAQLSAQEISVPANFTFSWQGIHFHGEINELGDLSMEADAQERKTLDAENAFTLTIRADLGVLPYSAEDKARRRAVFDFARGSNPGASSHHRINAERHLEYEAKTNLSGPVIGRDIMTTAVAVLLQSAPYFERVRAALPARNSTGPKTYAAEHRVH